MAEHGGLSLREAAYLAINRVVRTCARGMNSDDESVTTCGNAIGHAEALDLTHRLAVWQALMMIHEARGATEPTLALARRDAVSAATHGHGYMPATTWASSPAK